MKIVEAFPTWNYECPYCGEISEICDGDFNWNSEEGLDTTTHNCSSCGEQVMVSQPE